MFSVSDLYGAEFDFPFRDEEPRVTYTVATIPRTGSTYCATLFWRTGVLGSPMEYTNIHTMAGLIQRLGGGDLVAYWKELKRRRTSQNGVFGYKLFVTTFHWISKNRPELLPHIAPEHVIYLTRTDKIAQAVSYARAIQTEAWFAGVNERNSPSYSFNHIQGCERSIKLQEAEWEHIFAVTNTHPLRIDYDQVRDEPSSVLQQVCERLGAALEPGLDCSVPELERQSDMINRDWILRYKAELTLRRS